MTFGSWAYHGNEIDLKFYEDLEQMDISDLEKDNTEWVITAKTENRRIQVSNKKIFHLASENVEGYQPLHYATGLYRICV